jgi:hypothetical protein
MSATESVKKQNFDIDNLFWWAQKTIK